MRVKKKVCCDCGKVLTKDEIALSQKLIDLDTEDFYCLPCMAEYIGCSEDDLHIKIREFKEQGSPKKRIFFQPEHSFLYA